MLKYFKFLLLCLIWSTTWSFIKIGLEGTPPKVGLALRFALAGFILLVIIYLTKTPIKTDRLSLILYSLVGLINMALSYFCTYWGTQYIPSGLSSILWATLPIFIGLFAIFILKGEESGWLGMIAIFLAVVGVTMILKDENLVVNKEVIWGSIVVLFGVAVSAFPTVLLKKYQDHYDPLALTAMSMVIGAIVHIIAATMSGEWARMTLDWKNLGAIAYLGVFGSALAFLVYYDLLKEIAVVKLSFVTFVTPVLALIIGNLWLKEPITSREVLGSIFIFGGIMLYDWRKYKKFFIVRER